MAVFTSRADFANRKGTGKGFFVPFSVTGSGGNGTAAVAGSGGISLMILANSIGSTFPSTLQSIPLPPGPTASFNLNFLTGVSNNSGRGFYLAYLYKIGTLVLTSTGNQFTHDAATFPVTRTQFGAATKPVTLLPMLTVTTALTVTAAILRLRNHAGPGNGYTNQDGTGVTGATDFTFPSVTTAINSCYIPMLEGTDSGVQDISFIDVTTASSSGACDVWGVELLAPLNQLVSGLGSANDALIAGFNPVDLSPAVATSGTATSALVVLVQTNSSTTLTGWLEGALDA